MKLLLDTNILIDFLRSREPFYEPARLLMALGKTGEFELWVSPTQLGDLCYVLTQGGKPSLASAVAEELRRIRSFVQVCPFGGQEADRALKAGWADLEDAFVHEAARSIRADAIITRNRGDFEKATLRTFDCEGFFDWCAEELGVSYAEMAL